MFFSIINNLLMNEFANSTHKPSSEEAISIASALFGPTVTVRCDPVCYWAGYSG